MQNVVLSGASIAPMGSFQGDFNDFSAGQLGGSAILAAMQSVEVSTVDKLVMGNVLPAGQGQAPARQAGFAAGLGEEVTATPVNKMCGSGMKTTMMGFDQFTRHAQDEFALPSLSNALKAQENGGLDVEISPFEFVSRRTTEIISADEQSGKARPEKIPQLKPVFRTDGIVAPANASSISDGAAALILVSQTFAEAHHLPQRAQILGHVTHAQALGWFTTVPVPATQKLLERIGWNVADVDLWEVNEAFAVVPMAFMRDMRVARERLNIHGGACALGHPIGASDARIIVTLLHALEPYDLKRGVAAVCIGDGEGTAIATEP